MNCSHFISSFVSLTDVNVSPKGGLPSIKVGVTTCPKHCMTMAGTVWLIRQAVKFFLSLSLSGFLSALCTCYSNMGLRRSQMLAVKPACWHAWCVSQQQTQYSYKDQDTTSCQGNLSASVAPCLFGVSSTFGVIFPHQHSSSVSSSTRQLTV